MDYNLENMRESKVGTVCLVIIVIFIAGVVLQQAKSVLFPFFIAVLLSFVLFPVLDFMTRLKIPRFVSILVLLFATFIILYLLSALFYSVGKTFAEELPKYGQRINSTIIYLQQKFNLTQLQLENLDLTKNLDLRRLGGILGSTLGPFFSFLANLLLILLFLIFILAGRGKTKEKILKTLDKEKSERFINVIKNVDNQVQRYLAIKTMVSFFTGIFVAVVLILFGVDFAIFFGFITFILNYIPNIGSFIATLFPVCIALLQFDTVWPAVWILVFLILIQQIMGNIVEPRLMGKGLGLSPLVVLFSLFFWGWLWGIPGMILAVPTTGIIKIVLDNIPELNLIAALMSKD